MQRSVFAAQQLLSLRAGVSSAQPSISELVRQASTVAFPSLDAAPAPTGSKIKIDLKPAAGGLGVTVTAGGASASSTVTPLALSSAQATPTTLHEVARVNVLHSSLQLHLLKLLQERFAVLADYPDFSAYFGKDTYYRASPETLQEFYALVDEYHRMYDTATEFESLSHLATDLIPAYRKRLLNPIHPAVSPTIAGSALTGFLLGHLKA